MKLLILNHGQNLNSKIEGKEIREDGFISFCGETVAPDPQQLFIPINWLELYLIPATIDNIRLGREADFQS